MKTFVKEYLPYLIVVVIVILIKIYVVTPVRVTGNSMDDTLKDGDIMILNEISYKSRELKRFDIVVIRENNEYIIKRIIGLPGEAIRCKDNVIYINGESLEDKYGNGVTNDFKEVTIPEGKYFVMGDNREVSLDSIRLGPISYKDIKGTTKLTVFPFSRFGEKEWLYLKKINMI